MDTGLPADIDTLVAQAPSGTVHQRGFAFTVTGLRVIDRDQQHADETGTEVQDRRRGFEMIADMDVFCATSSAGAPMRTAVSVQWNEPPLSQAGSENVISIRGQMDARESPSLADSLSWSPGSLWCCPSSRTWSSTWGSSRSSSPRGGSSRRPGRAVSCLRTSCWLELTYDIDSRGFDVQTCSTRGTGAWALTLPDGTGVVELGVSERCVTRDQIETDVLTGFIIDPDPAGSYAIAHERSSGGEDHVGEATITLEGSTYAERRP